MKGRKGMFKPWMMSLLGASLIIAACSQGTTDPTDPPDPGERGREVPIYGVVENLANEEEAKALAEAIGTDQPILDDVGLIFFLDAENFQRVPTRVLGEGEPGEDDKGQGRVVREVFDLEAIEALKPLDADEARERAERLLRGANLFPGEMHLPSRPDAVALNIAIDNTSFELADVEGRPVLSAALDTTVSYSFALMADEEMVSFEGPGAKVRFAFDGAGRVTQLYYGVRVLEPRDTVEIIGEEEATELCARELSAQEGERDREGTEVGNPFRPEQVSATLVYYAPPFEASVDAIFPYYLCSAQAPSSDLSDDPSLLRRVYIAANDEIPSVESYQVQRAEVLDARAANDGVSAQALGRVDVGVEYIADSQGLPGSTANARGLRDTFRNANIPVEFFWGDYNAWERDFKDPTLGGNDSGYVDNVDFVFYTGHANADGFTFPGDNDDDFLHYSEARWGDRDLEWLVIAACGPLQLSNGAGERWWQRWGPAFDGLHQIMAYANVSYVDTNEGRLLAQYTLGRGGKPTLPLRSAWTQTAIATQPSSVTYAIMGVYGDDASSINDYFWGRGAVSPDLRGNDIRGYWRISGPS